MGSLAPDVRRQLHSKIISPTVGQALDHLLCEIETLSLFEFVPHIGGKDKSKKAVAFKFGSSNAFSVIANGTWLLWYFTKAGAKSGLFSFNEIEEIFPEFRKTNTKDPENSERTIKLRSCGDVDKLISFIRSKESRFHL